MCDSFIAFLSAIKRYRDQELTAVQAEVYFFKGEFFKNTPVHLALKTLNQVSYKRFGCAPDGEGILIDKENLEPVDMQESGEIVVCDISNMDPWNKVIRRKIIKPFLIGNKKENRVLGISFYFENGMSIYIMNWGDEIKFFTELAKSFFEEEKVELIEA